MYSLVLHLVFVIQVALAVTTYLPAIRDGNDIILVRQVRSATPCEGGYGCGPPSFGGPQFGLPGRGFGPAFNNQFPGGSPFLPRPSFGPGFGGGYGNANANAVANANSKGRGGNAQADASASANGGGQGFVGPPNFGPQPQFGFPPAALIQGGGNSVANANANANSRGGTANAQASATSNSFGGQSSATANANASSNKKCFLLCHLGR